MNRLILKSFIFIALFLGILFFCIEKPFKTQNNFQKTYAQLNENLKQNRPVDIVIFGSSHAYFSYNPEIIDKSYGTQTFNLGSGGQRLKITNYLFKELLKSNNFKPKLVILDIFPDVLKLSEKERTKGEQLKVFDETSFSMAKLNLLLEAYDLKELPSVFSTTLRNHNKWNEIPLKEEENKNAHLVRGFIGSPHMIKDKFRNKYFDFYDKKFKLKDVKTSNYGLDKDTKSILIDFILNAKKNNIEVLIITSPYLKALYNNYYLNFDSSVKYLGDSLNVGYYSFNTVFDKLNLKFSNFSDETHVNLLGANKVSTMLCEIINKKTKLEIINNEYYNSHIVKLIPRKEGASSEDMHKIEKEEFLSQIINKGFLVNLDNDMLANLNIKGGYFYTGTYKRNILLEVDEGLDEKIFESYEFGIHGVFYKKDYNMRPKWMLGTNKDRMTWKSDPEFITYKEKNYLILSFEKKCDMENFKTLRLFLKDKGKFKGVIGNVLEIKDMTFIN